ncbi:MAG: carboxypeptidase regulatory-like domain-containing protein [Bryobacterales bacterium]|nr:carboxypeptidase regulatory-like domain-containing protein [Bryobacterales bacterium]
MRSLALFVSLLAAVAPGSIQAQVASSEIFGIVTDPNGATVPQAAVRLRSVDQGFEYRFQTSETGYFAFPNLLPGAYSLSVEAPGFRPLIRQGLTAVTARRIRVDLQLEIGSVAETVSVTADAPLLDAGNQEIGQTIDNRRVLQLPLNGRSYLELATLAPNTIPFGTGTRQGTGFVLGGSRFNSNNLMVDGIDNNTNFFNRDVVRPSVDSIEEFRVLTNSPSAEFGRNMGGVVTVATKTGTNEFHGTAFWFHRNNHLNARDAFSSVASPFFLRNQYGASLGGPVRRNRLFFFGNFEKLRQRESGVSNLSVPSAELRQGIFPAARQVFDPLTTRPNPAQAGAFLRDPFPQNRIPEQRMDRVGRRIANEAWPLANIGATQYRQQVPRDFDEDQWMVRGDWRVNDAQQVAMRYTTYSTFTDARDAFPIAYSGAASPVNTGHNAALSHTWTLRPTLLNELRLGFNRFVVDQKPLNFGTDPAGAIGLTGTNPSPQVSSFPSIQTGFSTFGSGSNLVLSAENTYQITNNLTWYRGAHTFKTGVDLRVLQASVFGSFVPFGQLRFGPIFSSNPSQPNTGDVIADLLLGYPQSIQLNVQFSPLYNRQSLWGAYFQDDWRVNSRLTLNLGLRYELFTPVADKFDRQANPNIGNPLGEFRLATRGGEVPSWVRQEIGLLPIPEAERSRLFQPGDSRGLTRNNKLDFSPRFGFAYTLDSKTVLRGGFGVYRSLTGGGTFVRLGFNPPNFIETFFIAPDAVTTVAKLETGIPSFRDGSGRIEGLSPRHLFEDNRTQLTTQWNANLQRQLGANIVAEVGYLASRGRNLTLFLLENQIRNPADYGRGQNARPVPVFGNIWGWGSGAVSRYHAGYLRVEKRFSEGLALQSSYTFGKSLDDAPGDFAVGNLGISVAPVDSYDLSREYGPSAFDTTHRLVLSQVYELPFGRGRRWLNTSGTANWLLGGWELSGITSWSSGIPVDPKMQTTRVFNFNNQNRPNRVADGNLSGSARTVDRWFDPTAFVAPPDLVLGDAGRNVLRAPGVFQMDMTVGKRFAFGENRFVQFRSEFFNLTNTVNLGAPVNIIGNPNVGRILGSRAARQVQFALRIHF